MEKTWRDTNSWWIRWMCICVHHTIPSMFLWFENLKTKNWRLGTSLVVQWLRIHLPIEDMGFIPSPGRSHVARSKWTHVPQLLSPTLEPTGCNSWACRPQYWSLCARESRCHNRRSHVSEKPCTVMKSSPRLPQLEKACKQQWGTSTGKKKKGLKPESLGISPAWLCQLGKLLNLLD